MHLNFCHEAVAPAISVAVLGVATTLNVSTISAPHASASDAAPVLALNTTAVVLDASTRTVDASSLLLGTTSFMCNWATSRATVDTSAFNMLSTTAVVLNPAAPAINASSLALSASPRCPACWIPQFKFSHLFMSSLCHLHCVRLLGGQPSHPTPTPTCPVTGRVCLLGRTVMDSSDFEEESESEDSTSNEDSE